MKLFREAPTILMKLPINLFWILGKFNLVPKIGIDLNQFLILKFISLLGKKLPVANIYKIYPWASWTNWRLKTVGFANLSKCTWFGIWEGVCSLLKISMVCNLWFSNLNMYAMMQCKAKSENLAHILRYQFWAVTNLPPLQESRPEIPRVGRGKHGNP